MSVICDVPNCGRTGVRGVGNFDVCGRHYEEFLAFIERDRDSSQIERDPHAGLAPIIPTTAVNYPGNRDGEYDVTDEGCEIMRQRHAAEMAKETWVDVTDARGRRPGNRDGEGL